MSPTSLLELLANHTHHDIDLHNMIKDQPVSLRHAILAQKTDLLRQHFSDSTGLANMTKVVCN